MKNVDESQNEELIKSNALRELTGEESTIDPLGWIEIKSNELSYDGKLYPSDYRFFVKAVNAGLLKYFATLDETNPIAVQDALIYVVENHVRILQNKKSINPIDVVYEHDRLFFTLLVHQYSGTPTSLVITAKTPSNNDQDVTIGPKQLTFSDLSEAGLKYLNTKTGTFEVKTSSFGTILYKPLTVAQSIELTKFVHAESQAGEKIEAFFIQVAPFFTKNGELTDPKAIYREYFGKTQDMKYISTLLEILKIINIELKLEFKAIDEKTKRPFQAPVTSLRGIKDIFTISDSASELQ